MRNKEIIIILFVSTCAFFVVAKKIYKVITKKKKTIQQWDKEYNEMFVFNRVLENHSKKLMKYFPYCKDMNRAIEDLKNHEKI